MDIFNGSFRKAVVFFILILIFTVSPGHADTPKKTIHLGIVTLYHPLVMYRKFQSFADYLTAQTPFRFELKISQDYDNILRFLRYDEIDAALLGGLTYVKAREAAGVIPVAASLGSDGKPFCKGIFITRDTRKDILSLRDLKGKHMAFASTYSTSGSLAPFFHLYSQAGINRHDLGGYKHLKYHDSVAREVLRGNFDAGVVLDTVAQRYHDKGIRFIGETGPFPGFLIAVSQTADPGLSPSLKTALFGLDPALPKDRKLMQDWDEKIKFGFREVKDSDYGPVRDMIAYLSGRGVMPGVIQ